MNLSVFSPLLGNTRREQVLSLLILTSSFGGICFGFLLTAAGYLGDPGSFFYGCIVASCLMAFLAYKKPRFDIVSGITPAYAVIIFLGMGMGASVLLQVLFSGTLVVLLVRLHLRFS